jgi:hypothetical protein
MAYDEMLADFSALITKHPSPDTLFQESSADRGALLRGMVRTARTIAENTCRFYDYKGIDIFLDDGEAIWSGAR